jgi:hypothetical protein
VLATLFAGDFDRYFAEAGRGDPLWLFVHVPKTAGSSIHAEMEAIHKPAANIAIDYTDTAKPYHVLLDEAVQRFITRHAEAPYRYASGHILARHTDAIGRAVPNLRAFTMLRNPISRIISDYRYQRSDMNVARATFIEKTPDFATYIARPFVHNKTALALVPRPIVLAGDAEAAIDHVMKTYAFVGLQEMYPVGLRALTTLMGHPRAAEAKVRVNPASDENRVVLTKDEDAALRKLNAVDVALVQAFTQKWRAIRDDLRAYLGLPPPAAAGG